MNSEMLKAIKQKIYDIVTNKKLQDVLMDPKEIKLINDYVDNIKQNGTGQGLKKEELDELKAIYKELFEMFTNISIDWDNNKNSLSNEQINVNHENLELIFKIVTLIKELDEKLSDKIISADETISPDDIKSLQKKMKEALEKIQQSQKERLELEKKSKEEFSKYIKNSTIGEVSIVKYDGCGNSYGAAINLKDDSKNTDIEISEFLNSDFCKKNNIAGFVISNGNQKEFISGEIHEGIRYYYLGTTDQYGIKFNWYVDERECSITLSANNDGSIRVIGGRPAYKDLEENKDVQIKVGDNYLSLADAVKTCKQNSKQNDEASSKLDQPLASEHFQQPIKATT